MCTLVEPTLLSVRVAARLLTRTKVLRNSPYARAFVPKMEDKSAPQEGPREGAPASPGAGPNSPLQAANKHDAAPRAEAPQNSPGSLRDITNAEAPAPAPRDDDAFWAAAADAASRAEAAAGATAPVAFEDASVARERQRREPRGPPLTGEERRQRAADAADATYVEGLVADARRAHG